MANYITSSRILPLDVLFPAIVSKTSADVHGIKIVAKTYSDDDIHPVAGIQDIESLWRKAIAIADDGKPALRIVYTEKANGTGLNSGAIAATTNEQVLSLCFVETSDGEIALQIYNIT